MSLAANTPPYSMPDNCHLVSALHDKSSLIGMHRAACSGAIGKAGTVGPGPLPRRKDLGDVQYIVQEVAAACAALPVHAQQWDPAEGGRRLSCYAAGSPVSILWQTSCACGWRTPGHTAGHLLCQTRGRIRRAYLLALIRRACSGAAGGGRARGGDLQGKGAAEPRHRAGPRGATGPARRRAPAAAPAGASSGSPGACNPEAHSARRPQQWCLSPLHHATCLRASTAAGVPFHEMLSWCRSANRASSACWGRVEDDAHKVLSRHQQVPPAVSNMLRVWAPADAPALDACHGARMHRRNQARTAAP